MRLRFILSSCALLFGVGIVWLSLTASVQISAADNTSASERTLYFHKKVLPDHVFYPVLMTIDRARLESASPTQRVYREVEYANRRLYYAQELLRQEKVNLAHTTLTKAGKYLLEAGTDAEKKDVSPAVREFLVRALQSHLQQTELLKADFPDSDRPVIDEILNQQRQLLDRLQP